MTSMLCALMSGFWDTVVTVTVIVALALVAIAAIRWENARPFAVGFLAIAWFFIGVYSAFTAWNYYSTTSKVYGEIVEHDPYEDFNFFEYKITDFALEADEEGNLFYSKNYATSIAFDGNKEEYNLLVNNKPCESSSTYGKLYGNTTIHFDDVDGSYKDAIELSIIFTFYSNHIVLRIDTSATKTNASLLTEYVAINGLNFRILNQVYDSYPILGETAN